jgi:hypothetical protein
MSQKSPPHLDDEALVEFRARPEEVDLVADEFERIVRDDGVAAAVNRLDERWHAYDPPPGDERVLEAWLSPRCVDCGDEKIRFSLYCDKCWPAHAPS